MTFPPPFGAPRVQVGTALTRGLLFLGFWFVLIGAPAFDDGAGAFLRALTPDLMVGIIASCTATIVSLRTAPPRARRVSLLSFVRFAIRFMAQSLLAGVDVAWRALQPRIPLQPGLVRFESRLMDSDALAVFTACTSLVPGTLPIAKEEGALATEAFSAQRRTVVVYHCLDTDAPIVESLRRDESLLAATLGAACAVERGAP